MNHVITVTPRHGWLSRVVDVRQITELDENRLVVTIDPWCIELNHETWETRRVPLSSIPVNRMEFARIKHTLRIRIPSTLTGDYDVWWSARYGF